MNLDLLVTNFIQSFFFLNLKNDLIIMFLSSILAHFPKHDIVIALITLNERLWKDLDLAKNFL